MTAVLYIHGKGGSAAESEHYQPLFPDCKITGLDYHTFNPWETGKEIRVATEELKSKYENIILIANSIGAFFSMNADIDDMIQKAYFISPIVDMEKLVSELCQKTFYSMARTNTQKNRCDSWIDGLRRWSVEPVKDVRT